MKSDAYLYCFQLPFAHNTICATGATCIDPLSSVIWYTVWCLSLASQATLKSLTFWLHDSVGLSCGTTSWDALLVLFRVTAIYWKLAAQVTITVHWKACKCLLAHHAIMVSLNIRQKGKMGNGQATVVFSSWSFHFRELSALQPLLSEFWVYNPCS